MPNTIYNFDEPVDRSRNFSAKYDECARKFGRDGLIPMWIADMDLKTAQPIMDAMEERNKQGIFGYTTRPASYYEAVCRWQKDRNGYDFDKSLAAFALGVIPAICTIVREFTEPGQEVMYFTPVYSEFHDSVVNSGRTPLTVSLKEQDICVRYQIPIISDEIHSDLMLYGHRHTVMAGVSGEIADITITCTSATKTFNLAGLQAATLFFPNHEMKDRYEKFWFGMDVHRNNCFSLVAVETAFREGGEWLEQLLDYLEGNIDYTWDYLKKNIPEIHFLKPESTYLLWLDCRELGLSGDELQTFMVQEAGLALNDGRGFGPEGGGYMRMNIACPRATIERALGQLKAAMDRKMGR